MITNYHPQVAMEILDRHKKTIEVCKDFLHHNNFKGLQVLLEHLEKNISRLEKN